MENLIKRSVYDNRRFIICPYCRYGNLPRELTAGYYELQCNLCKRNFHCTAVAQVLFTTMELPIKAEVQMKTIAKAVCDLCNKDYTNDNTHGGFIFASKAVCPDCSPEFIKKLDEYNERRFIKSHCPAGMSFKDYVLSFR